MSQQPQQPAPQQPEQQQQQDIPQTPQTPQPPKTPEKSSTPVQPSVSPKPKKTDAELLREKEIQLQVSIKQNASLVEKMVSLQK